MSNTHWRRYLLGLIGSVVTIKTEEGELVDVLLLDVDATELILFYQTDKGNGLRGFIKGHKMHCQETGKEPAFKVPIPTTFTDKEPEQLQR